MSTTYDECRHDEGYLLKRSTFRLRENAVSIFCGQCEKERVMPASWSIASPVRVGHVKSGTGSFLGNTHLNVKFEVSVNNLTDSFFHTAKAMILAEEAMVIDRKKKFTDFSGD